MLTGEAKIEVVGPQADGLVDEAAVEQKSSIQIAIGRRLDDTLITELRELPGVTCVSSVRSGNQGGTKRKFADCIRDKVEAMGRTLIHETGHHLQAIGGIEVEKIAVAALRSPDRRPITGYAKQAWFEYLAETWAAYHVEKDNLKAFDRVGVKMIDDILRKIREILGT
jgi:hypothetical protein